MAWNAWQPSPNIPRFFAARQWKTLLLQTGAPLAPHLCARCGRHGAYPVQPLRLSFVPDWVFLLLVFNTFLGLVTYGALRKLRSIAAPVCDACRRHTHRALRVFQSSIVVGAVCGLAYALSAPFWIGVMQTEIPAWQPSVDRLFALAALAAPLAGAWYQRSRCIRLTDVSEMPVPAAGSWQRVEVLKLANVHPSAIEAACRRPGNLW